MTTSERVRAALSGSLVGDVVTALTFVSPAALAATSGERRGAQGFAYSAHALGVDLAFVPSWVPWAPAAVRLLLDAGISPAWVVRGPMWPALEQQGVEVGLRMTARDPEALAPALDAQVERSRTAVVSGMRLGAEAIVAAEDLAGSHGPLVAPDFALAEVLPRIETVLAPALDAGLPTVLHSDGDIRLLLHALSRCGVDAVHAGGGLSREAFERLFWAARRLALGVMGGIPTADLVSTTRAVFAGTSASLLVSAGGLLVADDGGIDEPKQMTYLTTALAAARSVERE